MDSFLHGTSAPNSSIFHMQEPSNPSTTHSAATTTQILNSTSNLPDTDDENQTSGSFVEHQNSVITKNYFDQNTMPQNLKENSLATMSVLSQNSPLLQNQLPIKPILQASSITSNNSNFTNTSNFTFTASSIIEKFTSADCQLLQRKLPCVFLDQETIQNSTALNCCLCQNIVCFPMILSCGHSACKECCLVNGLSDFGSRQEHPYLGQQLRLQPLEQHPVLQEISSQSQSIPCIRHERSTNALYETEQHHSETMPAQRFRPGPTRVTLPRTRLPIRAVPSKISQNGESQRTSTSTITHGLQTDSNQIMHSMKKRKKKCILKRN